MMKPHPSAFGTFSALVVVIVKIQLSKTKTIDWVAPWEKTSAVLTDVVGVELASGNPAGCPAVRLQRRKDGLALAAVGFVPPPDGELPTSWDDLGKQPKWSLPSAFRAEHAALTINSVDAFTRQTTVASLVDARAQDGIASSKDGVRSVFAKMADEASVLLAGMPEYQALWLNRLLPEGRKPTAVSLQTTGCTLLASLAAQPDFCRESDEACVFVTQSATCIAGFRDGIPLLFRECSGAAGAAAMREAVKSSLGIDDTMIDTVFSSNGIIDTRPALDPLLTPVVAQIELSLDYLKSRLGAHLQRLFLMGDAAGCKALKATAGNQLSLPFHTPNAFEGLELPAKSVGWKDQYCTGDTPQVFLAALGAALAALEGAS